VTNEGVKAGWPNKKGGLSTGRFYIFGGAENMCIAKKPRVEHAVAGRKIGRDGGRRRGIKKWSQRGWLGLGGDCAERGDDYIIHGV